MSIAQQIKIPSTEYFMEHFSPGLRSRFDASNTQAVELAVTDAVMAFDAHLAFIGGDDCDLDDAGWTKFRREVRDYVTRPAI